MVHFGEAKIVLARRQVVLDAAYQAHPERFVRRPPKPLSVPRGCLDQQTPARRKDKGRKSLNSHAGCLKMLDARRLHCHFGSAAPCDNACRNELQLDALIQ